MLRKLTLKNYLEKVEKNEIKPQEVIDELNAAIDKENPKLNIYLARNKETYQEKTGHTLYGAPLAIKDNFLTKGMATTASAKILEHFVPPYESTVTLRLLDSGAYFLGKTNMDAWAHGSSTETSDFGVTKNPRNPEYLPGGSSGGSAAAVAANLCIAAIGSETAGSIRQPAAWCGVVGLKPTYGRCSRAGVVAMGSSLDSPGPMGKTVEDCAILYDHIAGHDIYDGTTTPDKPISLVAAIKDLDRSSLPLKGMRIGLTYTDFDQIDKQARTSILEAGKLFENLGAIVDTIPLSNTPEKGKILTPTHAIEVYTVVQRSEVSSNLARYDGVRFGADRSHFGDEAKRRIMLGTFTLSKGYSDKYYAKAQAVRSLYIQNFAELFSKYDALISTPTPGYALKLGATNNDPMFGEMQDMLVEPSSLSGLPGLSVPMYQDKNTNLFLGLNIIAPAWREDTMAKLGHLYEVNTSWNEWRSA